MKTKTKLKKNKLTPLIIGLILLLSLIQLFISHRLATSGEIVRQFEIRADQIAEANSLLEEEVSKMGSLSRVAKEAKRLGLIRTSNILYLTSQIPVALGY